MSSLSDRWSVIGCRLSSAGSVISLLFTVHWSLVTGLLLAAGLMGAFAPRAHGGAPKVTVSAATGIDVGAATINGTLESDGGEATTVYLCWGTNDFGAASTKAWTVVDCGAKTTGQSVSNNLTGLIWGLRYRYRAYATNARGVAWSSATNFVTLPMPGKAYVPGLSVRAWQNGSDIADLDSARYNLASPSPAPNHTTAGGTIGYATASIEMSGDDMEHFGAGRNSGVPDGSTRPSGYQNNYCVEYRGKLLVSDGTYRFATTSDDGSALWINPATDNPSYATAIVQNDGWHGMTTENSAPVALSAGYHNIIVRHYEGGGGNGLQVQWDPAGGTSWAAIPGANFFHLVAGGATFEITNTTATAVGTTQATLNGTMTGSNVYFDVWAYWGPTDGTNNPAAWTHSAYAGAFTLSGATTSSHIAYTASAGLSAGNGYWYTLCASNAATNIWTTPSKGFITGAVTLKAAQAQAHEKGPKGVPVPAAVTVSRPAPCSDVSLTVAYAISGSARNGEDYTKLTGVVTLPAGAATADIVIAPWNDMRVEGDETVIITLLPGPYIVGVANAATVTITDTLVRSFYVSPQASPTPPYDTWATGFSSLQAALAHPDTRADALIHLPGGVTFTGPTRGEAHPDNTVFRWNRANNVMLLGGYRADLTLPRAEHPGPRAAGQTVLRRSTDDRVRVLTMTGVSNAVIEQITIRDGRVGGNRALGGGLFLADCANVAIRDCKIVSNACDHDSVGLGGGMYLAGSQGALSDTAISANAVDGPDSYGGGVYVHRDSRLTVTRSTIEGNWAVSKTGGLTQGGGFYVVPGGDLEIEDTKISGNTP